MAFPDVPSPLPASQLRCTASGCCAGPSSLACWAGAAGVAAARVLPLAEGLRACGAALCHTVPGQPDGEGSCGWLCLLQAKQVFLFLHPLGTAVGVLHSTQPPCSITTVMPQCRVLKQPQHTGPGSPLLWGTLTTLTAGEVTQQGTDSPGGSWRALMVPS